MIWELIMKRTILCCIFLSILSLTFVHLACNRTKKTEISTEKLSKSSKLFHIIENNKHGYIVTSPNMVLGLKWVNELSKNRSLGM
jgi:hypothetical protein